MLNRKQRASGFAILLALLCLLACSSLNRASSGVTRMDESILVETPGKLTSEFVQRSTTSKQSNSSEKASVRDRENPKLTDEEITTIFTECMRDNGFSIPDPVLDADGTVKTLELRKSLAETPDFNRSNQKTQKALEDCVPLLEGATFFRSRPAEDEIELQDNILEFAECLRNNGVKVPDPDFSDGSRASMGTIIQNLQGADSRIEKILDRCTEASFEGRGTGRR